jgi:glycosyltransferase family protein
MLNFRYGKFFHYPRQIVKQVTSWLYPIVIKIWPLPKVKSIEDTILDILNQKASIARFGDSEILYMVDKLNYQKYDARLAQKLKDILKFDRENMFVGLPTAYRSFGTTEKKHITFWRSQITWTYPRFRRLLSLDKEYYNANITRFYYGFGDLEASVRYFGLIRQLWENRRILLIEGEKSRLGVGNDLFANSLGVERILGPAHHAFSQFDALLAEALKHDRDKLVLVAMGPTAKALASELHDHGFQAVDIGNLDIEYEWYKMGVKERVIVPGKYTSEVAGGRVVADVNDEEYLRQILARHV